MQPWVTAIMTLKARSLGDFQKRISHLCQINTVKTGSHWLTKIVMSFQSFYKFETDFETSNLWDRKGLEHFIFSTWRFFFIFFLFIFFFFLACLLSLLLPVFFCFLCFLCLLSKAHAKFWILTQRDFFFIFWILSPEYCWLVSRIFCWLQSDLGTVCVNIILKGPCLLSGEV